MLTTEQNEGVIIPDVSVGEMRQDCCPIEVFGARYLLEAAMDDSFLMVLLRDQTIIVFKVMDVVLSSSSIDTKVKNLVFTSPYLIFVILEACLFLDLSRATRPTNLLFNLSLS
jgi:hypothetical protein